MYCRGAAVIVSESSTINEKCNLSEGKDKELNLNQFNRDSLNENDLDNSKTKIF